MKLLALAAVLVAQILAGAPAQAATNSAVGGIAGIANGTLTNGDGSGAASLSLTGTGLALVKQARDLAGSVLAGGASVSAGQEIYFVLYVDNTTPFAANDIRLTDLINEAQFTFVPGSLEQTVVASGSNDTAIWAGTWGGLTDAVNGDAASATDTGGTPALDRVTIGAVSGQANAVVNLPASSLAAYRFRVTVN